MDNWNFSLIEYWDWRRNAINRQAARLNKLTQSERALAFDIIRNSVLEQTRDLADERLLQAAVSMVDDLYKTINDELLMAPALFEYIDAFGHTFTQAVRERGYVIRYVVENQFSGVDFLKLGPFDVFPRVFNAAGFVYICPQHLSYQRMQQDGFGGSEDSEAISQYAFEGRYLGDRLVIRCHDESKHFAFLEADYQEGALDFALRYRSAPGVLNIFRDDAPIAGSEVYVGFPEQKLDVSA